MHREFLMGNEAIGLGALAAGVDVVAGYPGTPSTEVIETIARRRQAGTYVEWSVNEKSAMEVAAGAAYSGARALVTMKQVGLNVAADPLMSLEYVGVKGGMVVVVADDPGPISSQTEQDTRTFGMFAKVPVLDPSSVADAYAMVQDAFELSEREHTPVILRPTTRVDHGYESIEVKDPGEWHETHPEGFVKDSSRWVIFPRLSTANHALIEERNERLSRELSAYAGNLLEPGVGSCARLGVATQGASLGYVRDCLAERADGSCPRLLRVATPFPFPEELAVRFLEGLDAVLVVEELDPYIERQLVYVCGRHGLRVRVLGRMGGAALPRSGEMSPEVVARCLDAFLPPVESAPDDGAPGADGAGSEALLAPGDAKGDPAPQLPVRPPVLCAGCPHRASFYAVKVAMRGRKTVFCGDIGCYTLGNAKPLDMCDTCLCMGAGINIAQGVRHVEPDTRAFAFVGDSTFFASGITGVVNAFYNQADLTLVVLDNSTTAMTGHQPHPGIGRTAMGEVVERVSIERVLRGIGLTCVETVDPLDQELAVSTVRRVSEEPGVKAIIFRSPCVVLARPAARSRVDLATCIGCRRCVGELGCPALFVRPDGKVEIDETQCTGCTLCEQVCPVGAISGGERL